MKLIIFDVGNAFCSLVSSPNGYGLMVDCGSNEDKENPVDAIYRYRNWLQLRSYVTRQGMSYPLGLLHITHPDEDHVRNAVRIKKELTPYLMHKMKWEEFPDGTDIYNEYRTLLDNCYRGSNPEAIDWGFDINKTFSIPIEVVRNNPKLKDKVRNNSSILRYIAYNGVKVLFTGDLESAGWEWLIEHDQDFVQTIKYGVDILIAPHHGHKSGFPKALFDVIGNVKMVIHSKDSEAGKDGTDVATQYSNYACGAVYNVINGTPREGKVLTTRSNGNICIEIKDRAFDVWTEQASFNHTPLYQTNVNVTNRI